jgi:hypothetical protein
MPAVPCDAFFSFRFILWFILFTAYKVAKAPFISCSTVLGCWFLSKVSIAFSATGLAKPKTSKALNASFLMVLFCVL